jgi:predicted membrane-bound spermidine synthase
MLICGTILAVKNLEKIKKLFPYGVLALATGFAMMTFELVAARLLAPTIGSSTFVWTNVIGVIIAALSIGYWQGGILADKRKNQIDIVFLCLSTAVAILLVMIFHSHIITLAAQTVSDARIQGLLAAIGLFALPSFCLGMISPYLVKFSVTSTATSGSSVANLSALNAVGSIVGTFTTGFILFGLIGSKATLFFVVVLLVAVSWLIVPKKFCGQRIALSAVIVTLSIMTLLPWPVADNSKTIDTASASYIVRDSVTFGQPTTDLITGPGGTQSSVYQTGEKELVFWYTQTIAEAISELPNQPKRILILGGGAYTLPEYLATHHPDSQVNTIEIDPDLTQIAQQYFRFEPPNNLSVTSTDARAFVNNTDQKFDVIIIDVYSDDNTPWQFVTGEFGQKIASGLTDNGVVLVNAITAREGDCAPLFAAIQSAYGSFLNHGYFQNRIDVPDARSNIIMTFSNQDLTLSDFNKLDQPATEPYTDDFAPIEHLQQQCYQK